MAWSVSRPCPHLSAIQEGDRLEDLAVVDQRNQPDVVDQPDDRVWTKSELAKVGERDTLAAMKFRGEVMTAADQARLIELDEWSDSLYPNSPGLPPEVQKIVHEVLGRE